MTQMNLSIAVMVLGVLIQFLAPRTSLRILISTPVPFDTQRNPRAAN